MHYTDVYAFTYRVHFMFSCAYVFWADCLGVANLSGGSSLQKTRSPSPSSHRLINCGSSSRGRALWCLPHPCWHIKWCCYCAGLVDVTTLLRFHRYSFLIIYRRLSHSRCLGLLSYSLSAPSSVVFSGPWVYGLHWLVRPSVLEENLLLSLS